MFKRLFPPRTCPWCTTKLNAGQFTCPSCGGNRLVPARSWPVTVASALLLVVAITAWVLVFRAVYREERRPSEARLLPAAATPTAAASPTGAVEQQAPALPDGPPTRVPDRGPLGVESPLSTPELGGAAIVAPTNTPMPEPTSTFTPTPTDTPIPEPTSTFTPEPTATPTATSTPTPAPIPVPNPRFRADQTVLGAGGCTRLRWDVDGVQGVYLDDAGRPGHSVEEVCPEISHTYTLTVVMPDGREKDYPLHIQMIGYRPLTLGVLVTYRGCDTPESYRAEISLWAQGGDRQYTYYLGDLDHPIGGPTDTGMVYRASWRTCGGMPGIAIVRSGDGQQVEQPFWVDAPPCCGRP